MWSCEERKLPMKTKSINTKYKIYIKVTGALSSLHHDPFPFMNSLTRYAIPYKL